MPESGNQTTPRDDAPAVTPCNLDGFYQPFDDGIRTALEAELGANPLRRGAFRSFTIVCPYCTHPMTVEVDWRFGGVPAAERAEVAGAAAGADWEWIEIRCDCSVDHQCTPARRGCGQERQVEVRVGESERTVGAAEARAAEAPRVRSIRPRPAG